MLNSKYKIRKLAFFIQQKLEPAANSKLSLLDIYKQYETYAFDEGVPAATITELEDKIQEIYKNVRIESGMAGVSWRKAWQDVPAPPVQTISKQERLMRLRFMRFLDDIPKFGRDGQPFTAEVFAKFKSSDLISGEVVCGYAAIDPEYAKDWLRTLPDVFERDGLFYYRPIH